MTDFTELDDRARDAASRLRESVDDSVPSFDRIVRRNREKKTRGIAVMAAAATLIFVAAGVGASMVRTGSERPEPGVQPLQGAWALPEATADVSTEPHPRASSGSSKPVVTPPRPAARVVKGPWTAVVRGHRLTLLDPATKTTIVQRIDSPEPGRFSVVEVASGGTASFGCANIGEYSFERTDGGALHVQAVADACIPRAEILVAGSWTGLGLSSTTSLPTPDPASSPSTSIEPSPGSSAPDTGTPPTVDPTPSDPPTNP